MNRAHMLGVRYGLHDAYVGGGTGAPTLLDLDLGLHIKQDLTTKLHWMVLLLYLPPTR